MLFARNIPALPSVTDARYSAGPMRLLDRYLFRELLTWLAFCLIGIQAFVTFFSLFTDLSTIQERKLHLWDTIEYSVVSAMDYLTIVLPISLLLALLFTLTNHARHNEITAMRAAGMSLWRVSAPYLLVGFLASLVLFGLNEVCVPRSTEWADRILNRYVPKSSDLESQNRFTDFVNARDHRLWHFSEYRSGTAEMLNPVVSWTLPDGSSRQLKADRAIHTNGVWVFFDAQEFKQANARAPLVPAFQAGVLPMPEFTETPKQIESEKAFSVYLSLHGSRKPDIPLAIIFNYLRLHPNLAHPKGFWLFSSHPNPEFSDGFLLFTKLYGRLAAPWTCLVVVLIAIPFGAATSRRNLFVGVAGSIFICFGYFVIQQVSLALGYGGYLTAWLAAWSPNLIFGATGLWLMARVR